MNLAKKDKLSKEELDLNNDGVFDEKDLSRAAAVLATDLDKVEDEPAPAAEPEAQPEPAPEPEVQPEPEPEPEPEAPKPKKVKGRVAAKDINRKYRKGDRVPASQVAEWERIGLKMEPYYK